MLKLLLKAGISGVVAYGVVKALDEFKVVEKATVLVDELLTRVAGGSGSEEK